MKNWYVNITKGQKTFLSPVYREQRIRFILISSFLILFSTACATDVANRYYGSKRYIEKNPEEVHILNKAPEEPYTVIADFQMRGETAKGMQKRAAKIGADAVIVTFLGGFYSESEQWAGEDKNKVTENQSGTASRVVGTAIKYNKNLEKKQ
jgi:hypothetical protein